MQIISYITYGIIDIKSGNLKEDTMNMKLKLARVALNLSQQELADRAEVTRQTIGMIEKGEYNPTLKLCIKIAKTLGKTLDELFWEENSNA